MHGTAGNPLPEMLYHIGEAAQMLGTSRETLRAWERKGFIRTRRSSGGYRLYSRSDINNLSQALALRHQGVNFAGIEQLLEVAPQSHDETRAQATSERALLGRRLRQLRISGGLSLSDVSHKSGLSQSFLSLVERDLASASQASLTSICKALGIQLDELVTGADVPKRYYVSKAQRMRLPSLDSGITIEQLAGVDGLLDCQIITMLPGRKSQSAYSHPGYEFLLVIEGEIEISIKRWATYTLKPGDSLSFDSTRPHKWIVPGPTPAKVLWINSKQRLLESACAGPR